jgi:hypothetical protein
MKTHSINPVRVSYLFCSSAIAEEQNTVDPEVRQQIEAALKQYDEA